MRRLKLVAMAAGMGLMLGLVPAQAGHDEDIHSDNIKLLTRKPIKVGDGVAGQGSDIAFKGKNLYAGSYQGTAVYKIRSKKKGYLKQVGVHNCPGSQGDVSVVGKMVFVSIDSPASNGTENPTCNNTKAVGFTEAEKSTGLEGIRVVDFSKPRKPKQVAFVATKCGSHTHTLAPDGAKTYMYIMSYPLGAATGCDPVQGHGLVSILEFPTKNPAAIKLAGTFDVTPTPLPNDAPIGCHDMQTWPEKDIVIAACITESQVWDISNPAEPQILARITDAPIEIHHSAAFTWDGKYAIISDEHGGAQPGSGGCAGEADSTVGAMWFYNIEDPSNPVNEGHYSLPRIPPADDDAEGSRLRCTTHIYTILPMKNDKYIAVSSYYAGGISAVDFTDPANPVEIGHYLQVPSGVIPDSWAAYWYNGRIYTNDHLSGFGITAFKMKGTGRKQVRYYKGGLNPQTQISNFK